MTREDDWTDIAELFEKEHAGYRPQLRVEHLQSDRWATVGPPAERRGVSRPVRIAAGLAAAAAVAAALMTGVRMGARVDPADTPRPPASPPTTVPAASPPALASWTFEDVTGTTAKGTPASAPPLTWRQGVHVEAGLHGQSLRLTGAWPSAAATAGPVLDTTGSFSISAFVRAAAPRDCISQVVASQDGEVVSGFYLGLTATCPTAAAAAGGPRFRFTMLSADADSATAHDATSSTQVEYGRWYHLVAVRDASTSEMRLYVDGRLEATATNTDRWSATGPLAVGRSRFSSQDRDFFLGSIDTTSVYDRALSTAEVAELAAGR